MSEVNVSNTDTVKFTELTEDQELELNEFQEFLKMHASPVNEVEKAIQENPEKKILYFGSSRSCSC